MSTNVGSIHYDLGLDTSKFDRAHKGIRGKLSTVGSGLMKLGKVFAVTGASAAVFGGFAVKAFNESERGVAQLNAVLKSTKGAAGVSAKAVLNLSEKLSILNAVDDEAVLAAENMLLTFTNIGKDVFPDTTQAAIDMATAMNNGLTPSAEQLQATTIRLGKALQDPDVGLGALRRVGVNVEELKKKFTDSMSIQEKQKLILQELSTEFGGSGAAAAKTFGGQINRIRIIFGNLMEKIGGGIANFISPLIDKFSNWLVSVGGLDGALAILKSRWDTFMSAVGRNRFLQGIFKLFKDLGNVIVHNVIPAIKEAVPVIANFITGAFQWLIDHKDIFIGVWNAFTSIITVVVNLVKSAANIFMAWFWPSIKALALTIWNQLVPSLASLWTSFKRVIDALNPALTIALKIIGAILGGLFIGIVWLVINAVNILAKAIGLIAKAIAIVIGWLSNLVKWFGNVIVGAVKVGAAVISWFGKIRSAIISALAGAASWLLGIGKNIMVGLWNGIKDRWNSISGWLGNVGSKVKSAVGNLFGVLWDAGWHAMNSLWEGMKNAWGKIAGWLGSVGSKIKSLKGPIDKDKVMLLNEGRAIMQGLNKGLTQGYSQVQRTLMGINADISTGGVVNNKTQIYGGINISNQQDADYLLRKMSVDQSLIGRGLSPLGSRA